MAEKISERWRCEGYKERVGSKISKSLKGKPHPHVGTPWSEDTRKKIAETKKRNKELRQISIIE